MCASSARRVAGGRIGRVVGGALLGVVVAVTAACSSGTPEAEPEPSPTPIAELRTTEVDLPRLEFCGLVQDSAVADALGGPAEDDASWGNGDELDLDAPGASAGPDRTEVVQEVGCAWTRGGVTARAWVFARPVTPALARSVVRQAGRERGCETPRGPDFGTPSVLEVCERDGARRDAPAGLFGQTWLACEVEGPRVEDERAEQWCVTLVNSLDTAS